jgi:hypothetical protein
MKIYDTPLFKIQEGKNLGLKLVVAERALELKFLILS